MSLLTAINEVQSAAGHAKPFMKLMDALGNLDKEVRAATAIQNQAAEALKKKTELEAEIPALQAKRDELAKELAKLNGNVAHQQAQADERINFRIKNADEELARNHAAITADFDKKIAAKKSEVAALQGSFDELAKAKADIQAQIDALRETFKNAHLSIM